MAPIAPTPEPKRWSIPQPAILRRALEFNANFPALILLAWLILYATRPFYLGLYRDDWWSLVEPVHATKPFSYERLRQFVGFSTNYGPRPLMGITTFLASSLVGASPHGHQFVSCVLVLAAALSLRAWLKALAPVPAARGAFAADLAVIAWLAMPWMLGITVWPTASHNLVAQILFTEAARRLLRHDQLTRRTIALYTVLLIACGLTYEAFYFQMFPLIGLYAFCQLGPAKNPRSIGMLLGASCVGQLIPIAVNRYTASIGGAPAKRFSVDWLLGFLSNVHNLPRMLEASVGNPAAWRLVLAVFGAAALTLLRTGFVQPSERRVARHITGLVAFTGVTLLISSLVYALAGYGLATFGVESRTMLAPSLSLTIALFALLCGVFIRGFRSAKAALVSSSAALIVVLAVAQHRQLQDWAESWQQEQAILAGAPVAEIGRCLPDSAILFVGPSMYRHIVIFNAEWDLTAAVFSLNPLNQGRPPYQRMTQVYPAQESYQWIWDGNVLRMELPGVWTRKFHASHLYVWRNGIPGLEQVATGFQWPPK
jgi:hypothetical protein